MENFQTYTAFAGERLLVSADIQMTLLRVKRQFDKDKKAPILVFEDRTGKQIDFDLLGTPEQVIVRLASHPLFAPKDAANQPRNGPGRPKLGIISREVSLLPRHWEWLEKQPNGISGTLRRLVEEAKRQDPDKERARMAREAADKFMWAMTGNLPGFEEATRALYAQDRKRFDKLISLWPLDIRRHLRHLAKASFSV
jgi:hypothetical protein